MAMRVTQNMLFTQSVEGLQTNFSKLAKTQKESVTGRRLNKPSDDPSSTFLHLNFTTVKKRLDSKVETMGRMYNKMSMGDQILGNLKNSILEAKDVGITSANTPSADGDLRGELANEILTIFNSTLATANQTQGGVPIFGGRKTDVPFNQLVPDATSMKTREVNAATGEYKSMATMAKMTASKVISNHPSGYTPPTGAIELPVTTVDPQHVDYPGQASTMQMSYTSATDTWTLSQTNKNGFVTTPTAVTGPGTYPGTVDFGWGTVAIPTTTPSDGDVFYTKSHPYPGEGAEVRLTYNAFASGGEEMAVKVTRKDGTVVNYAGVPAPTTYPGSVDLGWTTLSFPASTTPENGSVFVMSVDAGKTGIPEANFQSVFDIDSTHSDYPGVPSSIELEFVKDPTNTNGSGDLFKVYVDGVAKTDIIAPAANGYPRTLSLGWANVTIPQMPAWSEDASNPGLPRSDYPNSKLYFETVPTYEGGREPLLVPVGDAQTVEGNMTGNEIFTEEGTRELNVFGALAGLRGALLRNDEKEIASWVDQLENAHSQVSDSQSFIGLRSLRVETTQTAIQAEKLVIDEAITNNAGADAVQVLSELQQLFQAVQIATASERTILQTSLVDLIR